MMIKQRSTLSGVVGRIESARRWMQRTTATRLGQEVFLCRWRVVWGGSRCLINSTMNCDLWCLKVPLKTINGGCRCGCTCTFLSIHFLRKGGSCAGVCEKRPANHKTQWHAGVRAEAARRLWPDVALLTTYARACARCPPDSRQDWTGS